MTNQEILDNTPDGATHYDSDGFYFHIKGLHAYIWADEQWLSYESQCCLPDLDAIRSLADIKRIVELEMEILERNTCKCGQHWCYECNERKLRKQASEVG